MTQCPILELPEELREKILSDLFELRNVSYYESLDEADRQRQYTNVLRSHSKLYVTGSRVRYSDGIVRVTYTGPPNLAPSKVLPVAALACCTAEAAGNVAAAHLSIQSTTLGPLPPLSEMAMVPVRSLPAYINRFVSYQLASPPARLYKKRGPTRDGDKHQVLYKVVASALPEALDGDRLHRFRSIDPAMQGRHENLLYTALQELVHSNNTVRIKHRLLELEAQYTLRTMSPPIVSGDWWLGFAVDVLARRKRYLDERWVRNDMDSKDYRDEYRAYCADVTGCLSAARRLVNISDKEGYRRGLIKIRGMLCCAAYSWISVHWGTRAETEFDPLPWPRRCECNPCVCCILSGLGLDMVESFPPPDLGISDLMWLRIRHITTVLHYVYDARDLNLSELLRRLCNIRALVNAADGRNADVDDDIDAVRSGIKNGLAPRAMPDGMPSREMELPEDWWVLWCRLSLQTKPIRIFNADMACSGALPTTGAGEHHQPIETLLISQHKGTYLL